MDVFNVDNLDRHPEQQEIYSSVVFGDKYCIRKSY